MSIKANLECVQPMLEVLGDSDALNPPILSAEEPAPQHPFEFPPGEIPLPSFAMLGIDLPPLFRSLQRDSSRCFTRRNRLVPPILARQGSPIEFISIVLPLRKQLIHQRTEASIVMALQEMDHLVHDDILQALGRLLGQLGVEPNCPRRDIAAPPLGLHAPDVELLHFDAHHRLPLGQQRRDRLLDLLPVPGFNDVAPLPSV